MQQLAALLSATEAETFDQLQRASDGTLPVYEEFVQDHQTIAMTTVSVPPSLSTSGIREHGVSSSSTIAEHSSFSIDNILSRGNHGDERQHQQPYEGHHLCGRYQMTAESLTTHYHNNTPPPLPALPLTHTFYGQCTTTTTTTTTTTLASIRDTRNL